MAQFNFDSPGEVYCHKKRGTGSGRGLTYRRFETGAEALRFAIEHVPPSDLSTCTVEVDGERFGAADLMILYESGQYPFTRARDRNK
ncbi:MAG: hypothetical protein ACREDW_05260 [Aestuariivirgaceae bacterium]